MYCQRCGAEFHENTPKCPNCGTEYTIKNTTAPVEDKKAVPKISVFTKKKIIMTLLIAVILIAGGITAAVILSEGSFVSVSTFGMLQLADRYLKEMNYEQAIVEFRKILEIEPKNVDAYIGLAEAYVALGDNDKAIEVLERARENVDNEKRIEDKLAEVSMIFESKTETAEPGTEPVNTSITQPAEPIAETTVTIAGVEYSVADTTVLSIVNTILSYDDLENIGKLINLTKLSLSSNQISDITSLAGLTNLTYLSVCGNQIIDITPLAGLTNLTDLWLSNNQISDITPLADLANLTDLVLIGNQITDLTPLAELNNLTVLDLWGNQISDIIPLAGLTNLTVLSLWDNQISDITPLAGLTNLTVLGLLGNQITETQIEQLKAQLPNLDEINY